MTNHGKGRIPGNSGNGLDTDFKKDIASLYDVHRFTCVKLKWCSFENSNRFLKFYFLKIVIIITSSSVQ